MNYQYDVIIVGASVAGSAAAIFYAGAGLRVALIERSRDMDAYKKVCTHYLQAQAYPVLKRLGLTEAIENAGGVPNGGYAWTKYGWIGNGVNPRHHGYNIRREVLDPLIRRKAAELPNVELMLGTSVSEVLQENGRIAGIKAKTHDRQEITLRANLVVGADGRYSATAKLASIPTQTYENNRFVYFTYYRNLPLDSDSSQFWMLGDTVAYAIPNDNGLTMLALMLPKQKLAAFKANLEANFEQFFINLPNGVDPRRAERTEKILGMLDIPLVARQTAVPGLALVGDAALASDPVWGNGMSWALQSVDWLVRATTKALQNEDMAQLEIGLQKYAQKHHDRLGERFLRDVDFARNRSFNWLEKLFYAAAVREPKMAQYTGPQSGRLVDAHTWPPFKAIREAVLIVLKPEIKIGWPKMPSLSQNPA